MVYRNYVDTLLEEIKEKYTGAEYNKARRAAITLKIYFDSHRFDAPPKTFIINESIGKISE